MKFRMKPMIVEAIQFFPDKLPIEGVYKAGLTDYGEPIFVVKTLEGVMRLSTGDWLITGVVGEKYACKPDVFAMTYEPINEVRKALPPVDRLSEQERSTVNARLRADGLDPEKLIGWPIDAPKQYNACTDACDSWNGPCACGAWHKAGE